MAMAMAAQQHFLVGGRGRVSSRGGAARGVARSTTMSAGDQSSTKKAVVVGAGPVGISSANMLASRGWMVDVLERRSDPTALTPEEAKVVRTYPMAISEKGRMALEGPCRLDASGFLDSRPCTAFGKVSRLVDWHSLTCALLDSTRSSHGESVKFHWDCQDARIDLAGRVVSCPAAGVEGGSLPYDLLVCADGASSMARGLLEEEGYLKSEVVLDASSISKGVVYKVFYGLDPALDERYAKLVDSERESRGKKGWLKFNLFSRHQCDTLSLMMTITREDFEGGDFEARLRADAGDLPTAWLDVMVEQNKSTPVSVFGRIVRTDSFQGPSAVLVGDAAHAVTSSLGNGCNLGLGGVAALGEVLDSGVEDVPGAYEAKWKPQAHAFQRMEHMTVLSLRPNLLGALFKFSHLCSAVGGLLLSKLAPSAFPHALYPFWQGAQAVPYTTMRRNYFGAVAVGAGLLTAVANGLWRAGLLAYRWAVVGA